ncbi:MAG TPA: SCO family protein [Steroidobacteraceae bacterium]|jgi:protein SCO1/2|nr:SCO family protein [Steroidobacteraceae bacterium]
MKTLLAAITLTLAGDLATAAPAPAPLPALERVMVIEPRAVGDLAMKDQDGKPRRLADLAGAPALVFFGFTHCPDVCPTTLQKLAMIKSAKAKEMAGVRVVLVSVDGERDTPEVLDKFLERFDKDFVGLTAPSADVRELALKFSAPFFKDPPKTGGYSIQHSSRVYALDKQGRLRAELYDAPADATAALARALLAE